jgi:branched-chain amino acid transport system permease protein
MTQAIQQAANALSLGSTFALLALGLAMVFSILGLINFAHGELVTIGGYVIWTLLGHGVPWEAVIPLTLLATSLAAAGMELVAFRPLRGASLVTLLVTSFAVSFALQVVFQILIDTEPKGIDVPGWTTDTVHVGSTSVSLIKLLTFVVTIVALIVLTVFIRSTPLGIQMRAAAEDFQAVRLMGVRANRVVSSAFALSGLLAGVAALLFYARVAAVGPSDGTPLVINAFIAVILGGAGRLGGAVVGGFVLGIATELFEANLHGGISQFADAFALAVVVGLLLLRPQGLTGRAAGLT